MSMIAISAAVSAEDIGQARTLFEEYAAWLGISLAYQNFYRELATLPGKYAPPAGRLLLARCDGVPAGCGAFRPLEPAICEMKRLYVRPAFRGNSIGRKLAEQLIDDATACGYAAMRLDTMAGRMPEAYRLYRALGFREIPAYYVSPHSDTSYMELRLAALDSGAHATI